MIHVAIAGASGETGRSIVDALLEQPQTFKVRALTRQESVGKAEYSALRDRGVEIVVVDLLADLTTLTPSLKGIDAVISALIFTEFDEQNNLAQAAKAAGVQRFVPSFFGSVCPPRGVMNGRGQKEDLLDFIKRIYLPYTVIDVGWWYQIALPRLPSGKIDHAIAIPVTSVYGDGNTPTALTDKRDIGRYVARVIADPRTLNKSVFAYNELWTQNRVFDLVENVSGETIPRIYMSESEVEAGIAQLQAAIDKEPTEFSHRMRHGVLQYGYSWGIRGDNSPDHAAYLGYLDAKELYPDLQGIKLEDYVKDVLEGKIGRVYANKY